VTKHPQFGEQVAGHHKCPEICVKKCPHFAEKPDGHGKHGGKNPVTKRPQFAEQVAGHQKCPKIMRQNIHTSLKRRLDIANVLGKIL
jgi:hypothetical protein